MVASDNLQAGTAAGSRAERYRRAERAFWRFYGLAPAERNGSSTRARRRSGCGCRRSGRGSRSCSSAAPAAPAPSSPRWSPSCGGSGAWSWTGQAGG
jgi:hypothetical protein